MAATHGQQNYQPHDPVEGEGLMSTTASDFETFEVLYEFNKNIHHGVLCLDALTKHDGFDRTMISILAADVVKAKCAANAYLISVIAAAEGERAANRYNKSKGPNNVSTDS